jgi:hypothetical protein
LLTLTLIFLVYFSAKTAVFVHLLRQSMNNNRGVWV